MADNTAVYTGTGRRKEAVARVRLVPGTGKVTVNGREATQYFGRQQLVDNATAPLRITVLLVVLTSSQTAMAAASMVSPAHFAWASLALFLRLASIVMTLRRPATSPAIPVRSSVRSTV